MEEEIYTEDEKELLELVKFFKDYIKDVIPENDEQIKLVDERKKYYKTIEDDVIHFANERFEDLKVKSPDVKQEMTIYKEVTCTKCNFYTALLPKGEEKATNGFTYFYFICPKCKTKFGDASPNTMREQAANAASVCDYLTSKGPGGKINYVRLQINKIKLDALSDSSLKFIEEVKKLDERIAKAKEQHGKFAKMVREEVIQMAVIKHKIITGNNTLGES